MASTVSANLSIQLSGVNSLTSGGVTYTGALNSLYQYTLASGSTPSVTKIYPATLSVTTTQTLVTNDGSLLNGFGEAVNFTHVVTIILHNNDAAKTFTVGGGATALIPAITLPAGGTLVLETNQATVANYNLVLAVTGTASIDVFLLGN